MDRFQQYPNQQGDQQQHQLPPNIQPNQQNLSRFPTMLHRVPATIPQQMAPLFNGPHPVEIIPANMHPDSMPHLLVRQAYDQNGQMSYILVHSFPDNPLLNQLRADDQEMSEEGDDDRQTETTNSGSEIFRRDGLPSDLEESENDEMERSDDSDDSDDEFSVRPEGDDEEWYNVLWKYWEDEVMRQPEGGAPVTPKRERMSDQMRVFVEKIAKLPNNWNKAEHQFSHYFPPGFTDDNIEYILNPTNENGEPWVPPAERRSFSKDLANRNIVDALFAKFTEMIEEKGVVVMEENDQFF